MPEKAEGKRRFRSASDIERERLLDRFAGYYPLDEENKVFKIPLHFGKASDMLSPNVEVLDKPKISSATTEMMQEQLDDIPRGYKADFSITIDDYEGYSPNKILTGINDALLFRHLRYVHWKSRKGIQVGTLLVVGIALIVLMIVGDYSGIWGSGNEVSEIYMYLLDTFGCVLIWESVYSIFVERSDEIYFERTILKKIRSIGIYDSGTGQVLASEESESISYQMTGNRRKILSNILLLVGGFSLISLAVFGLIQCISDIHVMIEYGFPIFILTVSLRLVSSVISACVGFMALRVYRGKHRHRIWGTVATLLMLFLLVGNLISLIGTEEASAADIILLVFYIFSEATFIVGIALRMSYTIQLNRSWNQQSDKHRTESV